MKMSSVVTGYTPTILLAVEKAVLTGQDGGPAVFFLWVLLGAATLHWSAGDLDLDLCLVCCGTISLDTSAKVAGGGWLFLGLSGWRSGSWRPGR